MALMDDGWEARMAARAAAHRVEREAIERAEERMAWSRTQRWPHDMTLGEAVEWQRSPLVACACWGGGPDGSLCCMRRGPQAWNLKRAAHIAVKLMADLASR